MFAPRPFDVAREMVRVTRPGGSIVMGNWIPNDPTLVAQILKISGAYSPPPPEGFISPMTWGTEANVVERFAKAGVSESDVTSVRDTYNFVFPSEPAKLVDEFRLYYGPTMNAFAAAEQNGRAGDLHKELNALFESQNNSGKAGETRISGDLPARDRQKADLGIPSQFHECCGRLWGDRNELAHERPASRTAGRSAIRRAARRSRRRSRPRRPQDRRRTGSRRAACRRSPQASAARQVWRQ